MSNLNSHSLMRQLVKEETVLSLIALLMAGISPNIFPAAQAGFAQMSFLATRLLIPSIIILVAVLLIAAIRGHQRLVNRLLGGAAAGLVATVGLEIVRITSFRLGGMPGSMPELLGVLLMNRFMEGPSTLSNLIGWSYHFWNGACFGMIFAVVFGSRPVWWYLVYAQLIGIGFLLSPAVEAMGIGLMGIDMPAMPITVVLAHLVYGFVLGFLSHRWVRQNGWLFSLYPPSR